jgi:hypothetical protein
MTSFDLFIYNDISSYYIDTKGDKNLMISNILLNIKDNKIRISYINHIDLYIQNINIQKETIQEIKQNMDTYKDTIENNSIALFIQRMLN